MDSQQGGKTRISAAKLIPVIVLVAGFTLFFALDGPSYVSFDAFHKHRIALIEWIHAHGVVSALVFIGIYAVSTAFSLPIGALLTISAGFLFGSAMAESFPAGFRDGLIAWFGVSAPSVAGTAVATLYIIVGATIGATALFLAARYAFADILRAKAGKAVRKLEDGFRENALSYMLILRLIPAFPFWLINLAPAFLGVSLRTYVIGTFLGIIPGTFVYALVGNGLGSVFAECDLRPERTCEAPNLGDFLMQPSIILPIIGLAVLAALPIAHRRLKGRRTA
jgi:uncharacterized membrane protein YdjX (TVP38/TMEM64 family)